MQHRQRHQIRQLELRNYGKQKLLEEEQALKRLSRFREHLFRRYDFLVDPYKPTTAEARLFFSDMTVTKYQKRFGNMTCHDICKTSNPMPRVISLLGLGFNFCLQKPTTSMTITNTVNKLCYDIRHIYFSGTKCRRRMRRRSRKKGNTSEESTSSPTGSRH